MVEPSQDHLSITQIMHIGSGSSASDEDVERHLVACSQCRSEVEEWQQIQLDMALLTGQSETQPTNGCPPVDRLASFCAGQNSDVEHLLEHISKCSRCASIVQEATREDDEIESVETPKSGLHLWLSTANFGRYGILAAMFVVAIGASLWVLNESVSKTEFHGERSLEEEFAVAQQKAAAASKAMVEAVRQVNILKEKLEATEAADRRARKRGVLVPALTANSQNKNSEVWTDPVSLLATAYTMKRPFEFRLPDAGYPDPSQSIDTTAILSQVQNEIATLDKLFPNSTEPLILKGRLVLSQKNYEEAIKLLNAAQSKYSNNPAILTLLGTAYAVRADEKHDQADLQRALYLFSRAKTVVPDEHLLFNLALVYERLSMKAEALSTWQAFLATDPNSQWRSEANVHVKILNDEKKLP